MSFIIKNNPIFGGNTHEKQRKDLRNDCKSL